MQIYRGCDIGTAKPSRAEQSATPHHLIDICEPDTRFSAAQWAEEARKIIAGIEGRGNRAIVCGGTGFWLRALLFPDFLSNVPPDKELRARLETQLQAEGGAPMWEKLRAIDADAAQRLHPHDTFRVLRALEIAQGRPRVKSPSIAGESDFEARIWGLEMPRESLYERIDRRVDAMIAAGALEELQGLRENWGDDAPALGGVGYKQMLPVLRGEMSRESGIETWKRDSRRYAKRQMTWFRHQLPVEWLDATRETGDLVRQIINESAD